MQYNDPVLIADAMGALGWMPKKARDNGKGKGIRRLVVAQGMCTPIRYHLMALLRPYKDIWNSIDIHTYAISIEGNLGVDGFTLGFDKQLVKMNVAELTMSGELAAWIEWLLYRHNARGGNAYSFLSPPISEYNRRWFINAKDMPDDWRQVGCDPSKEDLEIGYRNREKLLKERKAKQAATKPEKQKASKPAPHKKKKGFWFL